MILMDSSRIQEIYNPELKMAIKYKKLTSDEIEMLLREFGEESQEIFERAILENVITNLREVTAILRKASQQAARLILDTIFYGCLMLNPGLDIISWNQMASLPQRVMEVQGFTAIAAESEKEATATSRRRTNKKITKTKLLNLERHLKENVIGQDEAIGALVGALKRSLVGLGDDKRPMGVFLFSGSSGCGKSHLAKKLHEFLFPDAEMVRIDCGEYQHKHENQKLTGPPPGYLGHDEGGKLAKEMLKNPATVLLLDEVEKAHPDIWDTFLRVFDEGYMTDGTGKKVSFTDAIVIMTTNLGNDTIANELRGISPGFITKDLTAAPKRSMVTAKTEQAVFKYFRPEFLNRIDRHIIFNQLTHEDYKRIAELELESVSAKLKKRGLSLVFDDATIQAVIKDGVNHIQGARGLAQLRRDKIENKLADIILTGRYPQGTVFSLTYKEDDYKFSPLRPRNISKQV